MPGQLEMRFEHAPGGHTPAKSVLTWLEYSLSVSDAEHQAPRKPYAVEASQNGPHVDARITLGRMEHFTQLVQHISEARHALNGEWCQAKLHRADWLPAEEVLAAAPPRSEVRVRTVTPVVYCNNGMDDPVLTKQRIFQSARERWEAWETVPLPTFNSAENAELLSINGQSVPIYAHSQHRGFQGILDLKLHGPTERLVAGNALLAYAELWGIGKGTTVGAGRIEVRSLPRRTRAGR